MYYFSHIFPRLLQNAIHAPPRIILSLIITVSKQSDESPLNKLLQSKLKSRISVLSNLFIPSGER